MKKTTNMFKKHYLVLVLFFAFVSLGRTQDFSHLKDIKALSFIPDYHFKGPNLTGWTVKSGNWSSSNDEVKGKVNGESAAGVLFLNQSFQDVAVQVSVKRETTVDTGLLLRIEEKESGIEAILVAIEENDIVPYKISFDKNWKETSREEMAKAGGIFYRIAPPPVKQEGNQAVANRAFTPPTMPSDLPVKRPDTSFKNGEWNQLEVYLDVNVVRSFLNDGREVGATTGVTTTLDKFGPVALYIAGTGEVQFKNILLKDISIKETPLEASSDRFEVQRISDMYYSWGADAADFNQDGYLDVVAGPLIYFGPDFTRTKEIFAAKAVGPSLEFTTTNVQFTYDFNGDGWPDVLTSPSNAVLFINPGKESRRWESYNILPSMQSEITDFVDIDGDGRPELVYGASGYVRYAKPDYSDPTQPWKEYNVSEEGYAMAHGIGTGDINGDGRLDILNPLGWWEQPEVLDPSKTWRYHPFAFGRYGKRSGGIGGSLMAVYDVNGNGLNDVVTSLNAHGFGLAWFEQVRTADGKIDFVQHLISDDYLFDNAGGVTFSQPHGSTFADIDQDGVLDFIVGKRYFTHLDNYYDPDPYGPPVIYWYKTVRNPAAPGGAEFIPELIHNRSGAGSEITVVDLNKDGLTDIITSTNRGTFIYWNKSKK
jgi:hypothetical protein